MKVKFCFEDNQSMLPYWYFGDPEGCTDTLTMPKILLLEKQ